MKLFRRRITFINSAIIFRLASRNTEMKYFEVFLSSLSLPLEIWRVDCQICANPSFGPLDLHRSSGWLAWFARGESAGAKTAITPPASPLSRAIGVLPLRMRPVRWTRWSLRRRATQWGCCPVGSRVTWLGRCPLQDLHRASWSRRWPAQWGHCPLPKACLPITR